PPAQPVYHPHNALRIDNQPNPKHPPLQQPDTLHEASAPPYSQLPPSADQEEPSAPIDDPIQQLILDAEHDPNSAPIDDDDNISLAAPIYDPTAVAAPYLTYVQEPTIDHVDTSRKHKKTLIAFIAQLVGFLGSTIYIIVLWIIEGRSFLVPDFMVAMVAMVPVVLYAIFLMAFVK
ncbi:hypothetical protein BGZ82_004210, partial [Podila clonocystis]